MKKIFSLLVVLCLTSCVFETRKCLKWERVCYQSCSYYCDIFGCYNVCRPVCYDECKVYER